MLEFEEGSLRFSFDDTVWQHVIKYDDCADHKKIEKLNGTNAVDFCARSNDQVLFLEVKDFRGHAVENAYRFVNDDEGLPSEIGFKVRGTIAGIAAASRNSTNLKEEWDLYLQSISNARKKVWVILWLEEDRNLYWGASILNNERREKMRRSTILNQLKVKVGWLTKNVRVANTTSHLEPNIRVTSVL